jgi:hypothetical protein
MCPDAKAFGTQNFPGGTVPGWRMVADPYQQSTEITQLDEEARDAMVERLRVFRHALRRRIQELGLAE